MTGRRTPGNDRQGRVRDDAREREAKGQSFRFVAAVLIVGARLTVTPSEGALFSLLSTQETTFADIRAALDARQVTCRQLVQMYLDRIAAYDKKGPALNAIIMINANALSAADASTPNSHALVLPAPALCAPDRQR